MLRVVEKYQEIRNSDGTLFFVESSDNKKFHIYDKEVNQLVGKVMTTNDRILTDTVIEIVEECARRTK